MKFIVEGLSFVSTFLFASRTPLPGAIIVENGPKEHFSVMSYDDKMVVMNGTAVTSLEPGHILAYLGGDDDTVPLFRKVLARDGDTFTTTFASFAEIFPKGMYDASFADAPIEHFLSDHGHEMHRLLNDNEFCRELEIIRFVFIVLSCLCWPLSTIYVPFLFILVWVEFYFCTLDAGDGDGSIVNVRSFIPMPPGHTRHLQEVPTDMRKLEVNSGIVMPSACEDWMATDIDGNCLYADCKFGSEADGSSCFSEKDFASGFDDIMGRMMTPSVSGSYDFSEARCNQNYCYSSTFSKTVCDENVYRMMRASCSSVQLLGAQANVQTTFPISAAVLSQNCHMISVFFYLLTKLFGHDAYENLQSKQLDHQEFKCSSQTSNVQ